MQISIPANGKPEQHEFLGCVINPEGNGYAQFATTYPGRYFQSRKGNWRHSGRRFSKVIVLDVRGGAVAGIEDYPQYTGLADAEIARQIASEPWY